MNMVSLLILFQLTAHSATVEDWEGAYRQAAVRYEITEAERLVARLRETDTSPANETNRLVLARTLLLTAEWRRIAYEKLPPEDTEQRRPLGRDIDTASQEALELLASFQESAEIWRLRADAYGTMIRTGHQAKKYLGKMEAALEKALQLEPENPRVLVSCARRYLFADTGHGGDLDKAFEFLNRTLEKAPDDEPALLLRGLAYQKADKQDKAIQDWQQALKKNPSCKPAYEELEKRGKLP